MSVFTIVFKGFRHRRLHVPTGRSACNLGLLEVLKFSVGLENRSAIEKEDCLDCARIFHCT